MQPEGPRSPSRLWRGSKSNSRNWSGAVGRGARGDAHGSSEREGRRSSTVSTDFRRSLLKGTLCAKRSAN